MKKNVTILFLIALLCIITKEAITYSASAPPIEMTNAPGESNCTSCHMDFPLNTSGTLYDSILLTSTVALNAFEPNTTYTMSLQFANASSTKYGFQLVALPGNATSSDPSLGTLDAVSQETEVNSNGTREYMSHSAIGTSAASNTKTWTFEWTTPADYDGDVEFYVVVNCTNEDNTNSGDEVTAKVFSASILPVKWLSSNIKREKEYVWIYWATASESNNNFFEVERSKDAKEWETAGRVKGKGNSSIQSDYHFKDENSATSGFNYYRIKQVDYDGKFSYSPVMALDNVAKGRLYEVVYNDTQKRIYIHHLTENVLEPISLYNSKGEALIKNVMSDNVDASTLPQGIYFISFTDGSVSKKVFVY